MPFLAVGVEHTTAPLSVRERVSLDALGVERLSHALAADPTIDEVAVLSTCNRTELYLFSEHPDDAARVARAAIDDGVIGPYVQRWDEVEAITHLFRVAAGLESQIPGEPQILTQVRDAYEIAQGVGTIGPHLHSLFRSAISCARRARAVADLGKVALSVGTEAVRAAEKALGGLENRSALVIGAGEISRLAAEELHRRGVAALYVANRTPSAATDLAAEVGGRPATLDDIPRVLPAVDLVITATAARRHVLVAADIPPRKRPLHIFDLAIPRDVDPEVGSLPGITLHDLDAVLPERGASWRENVQSMEAIIAGEVHEFMGWVLTRRVVPVITSLRNHVEAVSRQELKRVAPQLADLTDRERAAVESLTQRLIDKMFHHLVTRLRLAAQTDPALVDAAEFFFLHGEGGLFAHAAEADDTVPSEPRTP